MRLTRPDEKGGFSSVLISALAVLLAAGLVAFLVWRYLGAPSPPPGPALSQATPSPTGYDQGDPSEATEKLLKSINQKLESLDLLKLLDREVETRPVTVDGKVFSTYHEEFRLPLRYNAGQLGFLLIATAKSLGAQTLINDSKGICTFFFNSQWTPVEIFFKRPAKPRICLIIDDGGYQRGEALEHLYALKVPVTVSIIPDVEFSKRLAEEFPVRRRERSVKP